MTNPRVLAETAELPPRRTSPPAAPPTSAGHGPHRRPCPSDPGILEGLSDAGTTAGHVHACVHEAEISIVPVEHKCECGMTWRERGTGTHDEMTACRDLAYAIYHSSAEFVTSMPRPVQRAYSRVCQAMRFGRPPL